MALDKTPDMSGLTPAERAAIYKQRAAAAGLGRPPSAAGQDGAAAAAPKPAPAPSAATAPAPAAVPSAPPAPRPAPTAPVVAPSGGVPAKVAAAAIARREQVAAVAAREGPAPSAKEQAERLVYVWPHLVTIEFMAAVLLLLSMLLISVVLQAPLEAHANPDKTPNPSKAPWYFLNLQELLLHMHPALAGVIIPGAVVFAAIPLIPYLDRNTADVGKWFGTPSAKRICTFTFIYTWVVEIAEIWFDAEGLPGGVGLKPLMEELAKSTGWVWLADPNPLGPWSGFLSLPNVVIPVLFMLVPTLILLWIVKAFFKPVGIRDYMFALFTGFVASYVLLTIVGTFFRGQGMHLYLPWDPHMARIE